MTFYQQNIDFGIGRHKELVRMGERRALRLVKAVPEAKGTGGLLCRAVAWLGRQQVGLGRDLLPGAMVAHGEQVSG